MWSPPKNNDFPICPSSVAKYVSDLGYEVDLGQTKNKLKTEYGLQVPLLGSQQQNPCKIDGKSNYYATEDELVEYCGMLSLSCNLESQEFLNSWHLDCHKMEVGYAITCRLEGMFTSETIVDLLKELK